MRWIVKATVQKLIGTMPRSEAINYFNAWQCQNPDSHPGEARFFEFGAGWDLIVPLTYRALGVGHQTLVDIRPNLRFELIADAVAQLDVHRELLEHEAGRELRLPEGPPPPSLADLESLGITYLAPCDARETGLPADSFDFASSTFTLEHIPGPDIASILVEIRRLLKPEAVMSSSIDMQDHYSFFDGDVSVYNYLQFSERRWRLINSPVHYLNRLRNSDYEGLFTGAGHEIVERHVPDPSPEALEALDKVELAPRFRRYETSDLAVRESLLITRSP